MEKIKELEAKLKALKDRVERREYDAIYRELNREKFALQMVERRAECRYICECGGKTSTLKAQREQHEQTKRHRAYKNGSE